MAILIKPIQRVNPKEPEGDRKWYLVQVTSAQADETQIAMEVADETTLNPSEAMMAIRQLRKIVLRHLLAGESVKFGNWGNFSSYLTSTGSDNREDVSARNIKSVNLRFQPDEAFKAELNKARFAWIDKLAAGKAADATPGENPGEETPGTGGETPDPTPGGDGGDTGDEFV